MLDSAFSILGIYRTSAVEKDVYNVLLAEQDLDSLDQLETAVKCVPELVVASKSTLGSEALSVLRREKLHIAIVNAAMPVRGGAELVAALKGFESRCAVIFVASSEQHAMRAFEAGAVDYLLKPISFERLRQAVRRAEQYLFAYSASDRFAELQRELSERGAQNEGPRRDLWVRERRGLKRISISDVDHLEAAGDYVIAHVGDTTHLVSESIASLASNLDGDVMLRIHRGSIVNLRRVRGLQRRGRRGLAVTLASGALKPVGPSYRDAVLEKLEAKRWR
jgi:DNA-binding LytR/AlgR family response regulator